LEQAPVGFGKPLEEFADFEMVPGHGANLGQQLFADIFSEGLLIDFGGEVVAALRGVLVEGALEEIEGLIDLALQLFPAEPEELALFAHLYAYLYAYFRARKSGRQEANSEIP
jgi:hypothetical protein